MVLHHSHPSYITPIVTKSNLQIELKEMNSRFAKAIGNQRYEDVEFKERPKVQKETLLGS